MVQTKNITKCNYCSLLHSFRVKRTRISQAVVFRNKRLNRLVSATPTLYYNDNNILLANLLAIWRVTMCDGYMSTVVWAANVELNSKHIKLTHTIYDKPFCSAHMCFHSRPFFYHVVYCTVLPLWNLAGQLYLRIWIYIYIYIYLFIYIFI